MVYWICFVLVLLLQGCSMDNSVQPPEGQYFTVKVIDEQFVMLVTKPETIRLAMENLQGKNNRFPSGRIALGNGGYNQAWDWHYVPDSVSMVEVSIEVCDAKASYVNTHLNDFIAVGYCPWSGKIIKAGR